MKQWLGWGERRGEENSSGYVLVSEVSFLTLSFHIHRLGKHSLERMHYLLDTQLEYCGSEWLLMIHCQTGILYWVGVNECVFILVTVNDLEDGMKDMLNKEYTKQITWTTEN